VLPTPSPPIGHINADTHIATPSSLVRVLAYVTRSESIEHDSGSSTVGAIVGVIVPQSCEEDAPRSPTGGVVYRIADIFEHVTVDARRR
jgi:hypothetical protein